jgi:hypothetical protein
MKERVPLVAAAIVSSLMAVSPVLAQAPPAAERRFTLVLRGGLAFGGPASSMEGAMASAGLADSTEGFGEPIEYPWSSGYSDGFYGVSLGFAVKPRLRVSLEASSRVDLGETFGHKGAFDWGDTSPSAYVSAAGSVQTWAFVASYASPTWHLGAGPALGLMEVETFTMSVNRESHARPGLVIDGGVRFPSRSRLFVEFGGQYRLFPGIPVGPIAAAASDGSLLATVPKTSMSFSHGVATAGLGVRF